MLACLSPSFCHYRLLFPVFHENVSHFLLRRFSSCNPEQSWLGSGYFAASCRDKLGFCLSSFRCVVNVAFIFQHSDPRFTGLSIRLNACSLFRMNHLAWKKRTRRLNVLRRPPLHVRFFGLRQSSSSPKALEISLRLLRYAASYLFESPLAF